MSRPSNRGIDRGGLDAAFESEETRKSNLILEAQSLDAQHQPDAAADRFAQAAEIEERLADRCAEMGLVEKCWVHRVSAASCWAKAGDFYTAIVQGEQLLAQDDVPPRLRQRVQEFTQTLRQRRDQLAANLAMASSAGEGP